MPTDSKLPPVAVGDVVAQKYRVDHVIGEGAFGVVVAARHVELGEEVALKFLYKKLASKAEGVERFLREARATVRLKSEHVVKVLDVGKLDSGAPYIVMERLEGTDLDKIIEKHDGGLALPEAVDYVLQAGEALAEAHGAGIVHRDLKPSNLFVTHRPDGSALVKVLDFGIAKWQRTDSDDGKLTLADSSMGSPSYMAPEQIRDATGADVRADIWSLGVILYEAVTQKLPFDSKTMEGILFRVAVDPPTPMRTLRSDVPALFEQVIVKALAKEREDRYQTISELADALLPFASDEGRASVARIRKIAGVDASATRTTGARMPTPSAVSAVAAASAGGSLGEGAIGKATQTSLGADTMSALPMTSRRTLVGVVAAFVVVGGIGIAALVARGSSKPPSGASTTSATSAGPTSPGTTTAAVAPTANDVVSPAATADSTSDAGASEPSAHTASTTKHHAPSAGHVSTSGANKKTNSPDDLRKLIDQRR